MLEKRKFIKKNLKAKPSEFKNYSKVVRANHELALIAIEGDASMYSCIDKKLKTEEFAKEAISVNERVLQFIDPDLLHRQDFLSELFPHLPNLLFYLNQDHKKDKEVILKCVEYFGSSLRYICDELLLDENFMLQCVKVNPCTFPHMEENFRNNPKFIKKAIDIHPFVVSLIEPEERKEEYYLQAFKKDFETFKFLPEEKYKSKEIIDLILDSDVVEELQIFETLFENRKFTKEILRKNGNLFKFLPKSSKSDKELIMLCRKTNQNIFNEIPVMMRKDIELQWLNAKYFKLHKHLPTDMNFNFR
jgi:hypothetical protein